MTYDAFCMAAAAEELRRTYLGAFVDQVYQPAPLAVVLALSGRGPRRLWLCESDARWPRSHAISARPAGPPQPPGFCMLLRKHLDGAHLVGVEQPGFDRVLDLAFRRGEGTRRLVHEVMGRHSNLMLLDETGTILGAVKQISHAQTRVRPVLPGCSYSPPPTPGGVPRPDPRVLSRVELETLLCEVADASALTAALNGWGTFAAREALQRGPTVAAAVAELMERVRSGRFEPVVFRAADGRPSGVWAFPAFQPGWTHATPAASLSVACESYFGHAEVHAGTEALRKTVAGALKKTLRTCRLQLAEARESIESLGRTELFRISGELLAASAGRVEPGATVVELPNWYDEDQTPLRIELDPELDARGNSARYFHRYRRAMAGAETALERIPELEARELRLTAQLESAACAEASELRAMIEAEPRLFAAPTGEPGRREPAAEREFPVGVRVRRVSVDGWEILYGENAVSNDWLTTRHARPHDLWLHARAVTGAHVIIRDARTVERVPSAVLREAARLAAAHSEAKHSALVPVDYTFRRYVRKPRGSGPGRVTYTQERTLDIDPRR